MSYDDFKAGLTEQERAIVRQYEGIVPAKTKVLEIGSGWGIFSRVCLEKGCELTTIDKIGGYGLKEFEKHTAGFEGLFYKITADSHELLPSKEKEWAGAFDVVFVDGDHTMRGASEDMKWGWLFTKAGGCMLVDDVFHKCNWDPDPKDPSGYNFGVTRALWAFMEPRREEIDSCGFYAVGHGLVLMRKP